MSLQSTKSSILRNLSNIPGWRTNRKLIVFESDDWGSIRMPSRIVFDKLAEENIDLLSDDGYRFNKFDTLATGEDLGSLFEVLFSVRDASGRPPVFTPVSLVANPDFKKIQQSNFTEYFFEPFTDTIKRYSECGDSYSLWKEGIQKRIFVPQFHGREHLNVKVWMKALRMGHEKTLTAFKHEMWGISTAADPEIRTEFQAAFDFIEPDDLKYQEEVILTGLRLFEKLFNYRAQYFVPPNGPFSSQLEPVCFAEGIKYLCVSKIRIEPVGHQKTRKRVHWLGQKTDTGLINITRNCFFEPGQPGQNWVDSCLNDISVAFTWHKPAIISSHRVNYVGGLYRENRDNGLKNLNLLLKSIMKSWPDAEFVTSAELGEFISNG